MIDILNTRLACITGVAVTLFATGVAHADSSSLPGKAKLDTVVPSGPTSAHSGAPAQWATPVEDNAIHHYFLLDRAEYGMQNGTNNYLWEGTGWIGGDYNRLWLKTSGEGPVHGGPTESAQFQVKYGRSITPYFSAQAGIRYDTNPTPTRGFAVFDLNGLAPYWFEMENQLYVSDDGKVSFNGEYSYEFLLTQKLILQPRAEFTVAASNARHYNLGSGLRNTEMGLRLRYEIRREFAPYIGVRWDQKYGDTKDMLRAAGESTSSTAFVVGIRAWY
ncbi:copper resistance protein B [Salinisphaera hydrothermalis]|uniref:copper resistance protein B n=1 Tax=Salinisphaera hydrothermalis TaxID=563188 RepID=UPI00333F9199